MKIILYLFPVLFMSCLSPKKSTPDELPAKAILDQHKHKFEDRFVSHFPLTLESDEVTVSCNTNTEKNDVGLFLYEYNVPSSVLSKRTNDLVKKSIVHYQASDTCLLIVNRFESTDTYESFEKSAIADSSLIDRSCYSTLLPIPNFVSYSKPEVLAMKLSSDFTVYVLEAKPGKATKKYTMEPSPQMPENWKNGSSKGIAISEKNKTIIYWVIIW